MKTLVIIPTYNEREALPLTIQRLHASLPDVDVLIVDDGSPDGTGKWADQQAETNSWLHVMHRTGKNGLGTAYLNGFAWGLERKYQVLCEMDADASHRPEQLQHLLEAVRRGADLAIGSRWVRGGAVHNWPKHREALSRGANTYVALALGLGVKDATAGFRAFTADALDTILARSEIESHGYCFQVDMTRRAIAAGLVVVEVPIDFDEREFGESKMSGAIIKEAMMKVTKWGIEKRSAQLKAAMLKGRER